MGINDKKYKERVILVGMTAIFLTVLIFFIFSSSVISQTKDDVLEKELSLFKDVLVFVQKNYIDEEKTDVKRLIKGAMKGLLESLDDPYSALLSKDEVRDLEETTTGKFGGVGLYIFKVEKGIEVSQPIEGSPALKAGIKAGDIIIAVGEESTLEMNIHEVVKRLKGTPGTSVGITVLRGESNVFDVEIKRALIENPTVKNAMIPGNIGYLKILEFSPITVKRVEEAIEYFKENKYTSLIIDLRNNPGGLLPSTIEVADLFFPPGKVIVSTKYRNPFDDNIHRAKDAALVPQDIPVVVLIDKYTASASEILTGALKDTGRAYIIGETSYGKGSVQQVHYTDDAVIKLSVAKYYTPDNISINGIGIEPDKVVKEEELSEEEEKSLEELIDKQIIEKFVEQNSIIDEKKIMELLKKLKEEGVNVKERYIRKMIKNAINRKNNEYPIYDLDFDIVIKEAVGYIKDLQEDKDVK